MPTSSESIAYNSGGVERTTISRVESTNQCKNEHEEAHGNELSTDSNESTEEVGLRRETEDISVNELPAIVLRI